MLTEKELTEYQNEENNYLSQIEVKNAEKQALYDANKEKVDCKDKLQKKINNCKSLSIVFGLLTLTILIGNPLALISPIIALAFVLRKPMLKKRLAVIEAELKDYDSQVATIDSEIEEIKSQMHYVTAALARHDAEIKRQKSEEKHSQYTKNHICIYVAQTENHQRYDPKPKTDYYRRVEQVNIFIDGVELGDTEEPYAAFEVTPGMHTVKIECFHHFGATLRQVVSKVERVNITGDSVFMFYHWAFYWENDHLRDPLTLKKYNKVYDFLVDTHQLY